MFRSLFLVLAAAAFAHAEVYCFGFLNAHPERKQIPQEEGAKIQEGHMAHMGRMAKEGRLLVAGPMATQGGPRGLLVYRCKSLDEIRQWTELDPAVQNKRLTLEAYRWNGPEGMGEPLATQMKADPKTKMNMVQLPFIVLRRTEKWTGNGPMEVLPEHGKAVMKLMQEGTIRAAGPFMGPDGGMTDPLGIFVFSEMTLDAAKAIAERDPLVTAGYIRLEPHMWFVADEAVPKKR